jgi:hypothetical protein
MRAVNACPPGAATCTYSSLLRHVAFVMTEEMDASSSNVIHRELQCFARHPVRTHDFLSIQIGLLSLGEDPLATDHHSLWQCSAPHVRYPSRSRSTVDLPRLYKKALCSTRGVTSKRQESKSVGNKRANMDAKTKATVGPNTRHVTAGGRREMHFARHCSLFAPQRLHEGRPPGSPEARFPSSASVLRRPTCDVFSSHLLTPCSAAFPVSFQH